MKTIKFYDTSSILVKEKFNPTEEQYVLSIITLQELENLKTSNTTDENTKYQVRKFLRFYEEHPEMFKIHCEFDEKLKTNDEKILSSAYNCWLGLNQDTTVYGFYFVTNDFKLLWLWNWLWFLIIKLFS